MPCNLSQTEEPGSTSQAVAVGTPLRRVSSVWRASGPFFWGALLCLTAAPATPAAEVGPRTNEVARGDYARIIHVSSEQGTDREGGGTATAPWQSLQHALQNIENASHEHRVAILVASGTYQVQNLELREYVDLYGGFEPERWQRDIFAHPTVLDARRKSRLLLAADHARVDGFVLTGGSLREPGGAILCDGTSPKISNNRFVANQTQEPADWNPTHIHELANDGGAICGRAGASPLIENNLFVENSTETGRGGAVSLYGQSGGHIRGNVFVKNLAGTIDRHRSSDGGALSVFDWSSPLVEDNLFIENQALARNDGGAVFVALWSSPQIRGNVFVGNRCTDDGGALFIGGQEHRYDAPQDPLPAEAEFQVEVRDNIFAGNESPNHNSGGMRITMEARAILHNNLLSHDSQLYIQDSFVDFVNNTIVEDIKFEDMQVKSQQSVMSNNVLWGQLSMATVMPIQYSNLKQQLEGPGNLSEDPKFVADERELTVASASFQPSSHVTQLQVEPTELAPDELANRLVSVGDRWSVVKSNMADTLTIWGDLADSKVLRLLPTFQLQSNSPCIERGHPQHAPPHDLFGDPRPTGQAVDIGADEYFTKAKD